MRREERSTQDLLDEALAETGSADVELGKVESPATPSKTETLKFVGRVVGEILEHLP